MFKALYSDIDQSVNFIKNHGRGGIETRYISVSKEKFKIILSVQDGCKLSCRLCHLTETDQNKYIKNLNGLEIFEQVQEVFEHYESIGQKGKEVEFCFSGRGDPLESSHFVANGQKILRALNLLAKMKGLRSKSTISTIIPSSFRNHELTDVFTDDKNLPDICYTIFSCDDQVRKEFTPKAMSFKDSMYKLKSWHMATGKIPEINIFFVRGKNDSALHFQGLCDQSIMLKLPLKLNIIRFNPYNDILEEASHKKISSIADYLQENLYRLESITTHARSGFDVKASSGMFLTKDDA